MSPLKFVKNVSETYFAEKGAARRGFKYAWDFLFIGFFALYLFQIYAAYVDWESLVVLQVVNFIDPDDFWQTKLSAIYLQGVVLGGVFVRFLAAQFRGKWAVRFGELGALIAIAAFINHYLWTIDAQSKLFEGNACSSPGLIGMTPLNSQLLALFFLCWTLYKPTFLIAVAWKTVRK